METALTLAVVIVLAFIVISLNKSNIPKKLKKDFSERFPKAKNLDWTKHKQMYEVVFFDDNMEKKVRYDSHFNWIETKSMMFRENMPSEIFNVAIEKYPDCEFNDLSHIENNKGQSYYKLIVLKDGINYLLKINEAFDLIQTRNLTYDKMNKFKDEQFFKGNDLFEN